MEISVKIAESEDLLSYVFQIRKQVFVLEQQVDEQIEYDEHEYKCTHFLAIFNGIPVGTARWRFTDLGVKLERFSVLKEFRRKGVASALISSVLENIPQETHVIYLHAQLGAIALYQNFGFKIEGPEFTEAGIKHHKMVFRNVKNALK